MREEEKISPYELVEASKLSLGNQAAWKRTGYAVGGATVFEYIAMRCSLSGEFLRRDRHCYQELFWKRVG